MKNNFTKNIEQEVIHFIDRKNLIQKGDKIFVALSGGADSVFLLEFLNKYKQRFKIEITALHINHLLRGKEAGEDELFCSKLCASLKIKLFIIRKNVKAFAKKNKYSIEEAGRIIRYLEFENLCRKEGFDKIATAHNANDNTETVLLNISRGAGLSGLSGIPVKRNNIIRPILSLTKGEILKYLKVKKKNYRTDSTNSSIDFERNFIRSKIIPLLIEKINPAIHKSLINSSENIFEINSFISKYLNGFVSSVSKKKSGSVFISKELINSVPKELLIEFFKKILIANFQSGEISKDARNIQYVISLQSGKKVQLSGGLIAFAERDGILIDKEKEFDFSEKTLSSGDSIKLQKGTFTINKVGAVPSTFEKNGNIEYVDADKAHGNFLLRNWKAGDRFYPLGMKTSKKVSDFLTDQKIAAYNKKNQLVLLSGNEIIWLVGLRIDNRYKVTKATKNYLEIKYYESK